MHLHQVLDVLVQVSGGNLRVSGQDSLRRDMELWLLEHNGVRMALS